MLPVSIFLCLVSNATRVYLSVSCVHCYPCLSFCVLCPMLPVSIFLFLVSNVTRVYLYVSCVHCYPCLSLCVLCPMIPVSIFLCLVSNVTRVYLSVSCVHCYPYLSLCVLCPMLPLSIFLCLVSNVTPVYFLLPLSVSSNVYGLLFIDKSVIEYKTWILIKFLWHGHVYHVINIVIINFATGTYWCRGCM